MSSIDIQEENFLSVIWLFNCCAERREVYLRYVNERKIERKNTHRRKSSIEMNKKTKHIDYVYSSTHSELERNEGVQCYFCN